MMKTLLRLFSLCSGIGGIDFAWSHLPGQEIAGAGQVEIDPPCVLSIRARKYYPFEMTEEERIQMLDTLNAHMGMVVLSGYTHPLYAEWLQHWQRLTCPSVAEHGKQQTEVLWLHPQAFQRRRLSLFEEKGGIQHGTSS